MKMKESIRKKLAQDDDDIGYDSGEDEDTVLDRWARKQYTNSDKEIFINTDPITIDDSYFPWVFEPGTVEDESVRVLAIRERVASSIGRRSLGARFLFASWLSRAYRAAVCRRSARLFLGGYSCFSLAQGRAAS